MQVTKCYHCKYCGDKWSFSPPNDKLVFDPLNINTRALYCTCKQSTFYSKIVSSTNTRGCQMFKEV